MASRSRAERSGWSYRCNSKCLTITAFAASILVVGAGGFVLGTVFARPIGSGGMDRANAILEEAKKRVPPPTYPPKPAGHTETETKTVMTRIPNAGGFLGPGGITIPTTVTVPKLVGATPEENAKWQAETDKVQRDYQEKVASEARKIANEMFVNDWRSAMILFKTYSADVILPFLAALAGIVGAVATLLRAFRTKPDATT